MEEGVCVRCDKVNKRRHIWRSSSRSVYRRFCDPSSRALGTGEFDDRPEARDDGSEQRIAAMRFIRGLLAPLPFDVASSDRHTVKPWFTARLPESPEVPRAGGNHRLQACRPHRQPDHATVRSIGPRPGGREISRYNVCSWSDADFTYVAVSDLPAADLATFERVFSTGSPAPEIKYAAGPPVAAAAR